jgi:hypothetical protein
VKDVGQYKAKFVLAGTMRSAGIEGVAGTVAVKATGAEVPVAPWSSVATAVSW